MREGTNYNSVVSAEESKRDMVIDVFWWTFEGKVQKFVHNNHLKVWGQQDIFLMKYINTIIPIPINTILFLFYSSVNPEKMYYSFHRNDKQYNCFQHWY